MAKYFHITLGLRGAYMPDSAYVVKCNTRRELKSALQNEVSHLTNAGFSCGIITYGLSKKVIAGLAAKAWREAHKANPSIYPHVAGYGERGNYYNGLHVSTATRAEYLEFVSEEENI